MEWDDDDFRFTQKDGKLYAFVMKPTHRKKTVITSLNRDERVSSVTLLGHGPLAFNQYSGVLTVDYPPEAPTEYASVLEICF